ncbi:MAG: C4-dicarboxylate ABC transporter [Spirochaetae bacterium HGW-Spirochaetae-1]|jgi:TRAP transporter 4TM/12TM fusion protein|nr:MAG: C4-dicarboxylate ABC transporter [Spirochaetae bacterium HGW-Spirochaetae-1]
MFSRKTQTAEDILKEETGELRSLNRFEKTLTAAVALAWALFQLSLASWLILDSIKVRAIHLVFAMVLLYLSFPLFRRNKKLSFISTTRGIALLDYILAGLSIAAVLYIVLDWEGLVTRMGALSTRDIIFGSLLILLLLEASRRCIGPALPVIVIIFSLYAFFADAMPDFISSRPVSLKKYINQTALSSEGIYGIPLGVSASIVYLFVLLGAMMDRAGAGSFFTTLALSLLGRFKGGPAKAAVVSSGLTGMISGSSIANIVTTGTFTIPLMKKVGYPAKKAAAIEVAASIDGQLMPPIMGAAAFIIAEYVNVPYVEVVRAALIPALVSYAALFFITHLEASKLGMKGLPRHEIPSFRKTLKEGFHYLIPISWLIYELIVLRHSPELAAFRAILLLCVVILFQEIYQARRGNRSFHSALKKALASIGGGLISGSKNMVVVALATAAAGIIVGIVSLGLGSMITHIVEAISSGNVFILLFITAIASLILGMGLPTTATYIVMASLTAPIIVTLGSLYGLTIPLLASHLFCFYFGILADDTPPVGLAAFAAAAIARTDPIATGLQGFLYDIRTAVIPFFFIFNPDIILHGITDWRQGLLVFVMTLLAAFAFAAVVQGWFVTKNKWPEIPFLLLASLILFHPGILQSWLGMDSWHRYWLYLPGLAILALIFTEQKLRAGEKT